MPPPNSCSACSAPASSAPLGAQARARDARGGGSAIKRQAASSAMRGRFITFEGGEGTGKSTHSALLADRLTARGIRGWRTREPGGSPGAEVIRHVLLSGVAKPLGVEAEALLFAAARGDHVDHAIE